MATKPEVVTKDELERREEAWRHVAQRESYECAVCGEIPPYGEREIYFKTGLCGFHAHTAAKKD